MRGMETGNESSLPTLRPGCASTFIVRDAEDTDKEGLHAQTFLANRHRVHVGAGSGRLLWQPDDDQGGGSEFRHGRKPEQSSRYRAKAICLARGDGTARS